MGKVHRIRIKCPPSCLTQLYLILDGKLLFSRCASNDERYSLEPSVSNGNQLPNTIITAVLRGGVEGSTFCYQELCFSRLVNTARFREAFQSIKSMFYVWVVSLMPSRFKVWVCVLC
ncbi:unnamed protein product [Ixodes persulcatus]